MLHRSRFDIGETTAHFCRQTHEYFHRSDKKIICYAKVSFHFFCDSCHALLGQIHDPLTAASKRNCCKHDLHLFTAEKFQSLNTFISCEDFSYYSVANTKVPV